MNLYLCQAGFDTVSLDLMVVAGDERTAIDVWCKVEVPGLSDAEFAAAVCVPKLIDVHLARPMQGYIERGTFKFIPVELP